MIEDIADGLARTDQYIELIGDDIESIIDINRRLPTEAIFGMTLGNNWNWEDIMTNSHSDIFI